MKRVIVLALSVLGATFGAGEEPAKSVPKKQIPNCPAFYEVYQTKSQLELGVGNIKLSIGKDKTQVIKPSDETLQLGMQMRMLCEAFNADPAMTPAMLLEEMHKIEDKQRKIEKAVAAASISLHVNVEAKAVKNAK